MADFNPSGVWEARLVAGTVITFDIGQVQPNGSFSGSANIPNSGTGQGSGWALGRLFVFKVDWPDQSASLYSGWLDGDRTIRGSVMGRVGAPTTSIGWGSLKQF
jgi:hypothetical protein